MKTTTKTLYIIPGWKETTRRRPYQKIAKIARDKGYEVSFKNIDWDTKLTKQFFPTKENDVVFGFSLGAILGRLVAQDYKSKHLILASMTQLGCFSNKEMKKSLVDLLGKPFVEDIVKKLEPKHQSKKQTILYGDKEEEPADILVKNTEHELTDNYIKEIKKLL